MRFPLLPIHLALFSCMATIGLASTPLRVALGETKPPYVDAEKKSGVEYEIVTEAFKRAGIPIVLQHMPNKRAQTLFEQGELDAAINTAGKNASEPYIIYKNMAITLCDRNIKLAEVHDLSQYQVAAFHNAHLFLGDDFAKVANNKARYTEIVQQNLLNRMIVLDHIDVAISDINIFKHFNTEADPATKRAICPYALFPPTRYRLTFHDPHNQAKFNQALAQLLASHFYEDLAQKYQLPVDQHRPYFKP